MQTNSALENLNLNDNLTWLISNKQLFSEKKMIICSLVNQYDPFWTPKM